MHTISERNDARHPDGRLSGQAFPLFSLGLAAIGAFIDVERAVV